ncbi:MAG: hypothetical protein ACD_63C00257G0003 [uncultured bacterium]|nr:MAG: hypothetical protein ACD_63C00257G0003 [uncultured bacterium]
MITIPEVRKINLIIDENLEIIRTALNDSSSNSSKDEYDSQELQREAERLQTEVEKARRTQSRKEDKPGGGKEPEEKKLIEEKIYDFEKKLEKKEEELKKLENDLLAVGGKEEDDKKDLKKVIKSLEDKIAQKSKELEDLKKKKRKQFPASMGGKKESLGGIKSKLEEAKKRKKILILKKQKSGLSDADERMVFALEQDIAGYKIEINSFSASSSFAGPRTEARRAILSRKIKQAEEELNSLEKRKKEKGTEIRKFKGVGFTVGFRKDKAQKKADELKIEINRLMGELAREKEHLSRVAAREGSAAFMGRGAAVDNDSTIRDKEQRLKELERKHVQAEEEKRQRKVKIGSIVQRCLDSFNIVEGKLGILEKEIDELNRRRIEIKNQVQRQNATMGRGGSAALGNAGIAERASRHDYDLRLIETTIRAIKPERLVILQREVREFKPRIFNLKNTV